MSHSSQRLKSSAIRKTLCLCLLLMGSGVAWPLPVELGDPPQWQIPQEPRRQAAKTTSAGLSVDTRQREAVRNFYHGIYLASEDIKSGWSGNIADCDAGKTSNAFRNATLLRVNFFRAMAGVPAGVVLDPDFSARAQPAALMMAANGQLSHFPPSSWQCYDAVGADAAGHANLSLGNAGPDAVSSQVQDDGDFNTAVGHRRWILFPPVYRIGTGDVVTDQDWSRTANALLILDSTLWGLPRPDTREDFVAWPPPGFFPAPLAPHRWSFSYPDADFSAATVSMQSNGTPITATPDPIATGYGDNTLAWQAELPGGAVDRDVQYAVTLNNVLINGVPQRFKYTTTLFDPARLGKDSLFPDVQGPKTATRGATVAFDLRTIPTATGYQWRALHAVNYDKAVQDAEHGLGDLLPQPKAGYPILSNDSAAQGAASYHLAQADGNPQALVFSDLLIPGAQAWLRFSSRLGLATTAQYAAVQVSSDDGLTWSDVYRQYGNDNFGETSFGDKTVDLGAYANRAIRIRFYYASTGQYYPQTSSGIGWYVDNIRLGKVSRAVDELPIVKIKRPAFDFTPPQTGNYFLAARAVIFNQYPLEWSQWRLLTVR